MEWLRRNPHPDLLLTDIHLADGDAFRIFDAVEVASPVVFTTAYDRYALEAFRVNSIDYLLKPINTADVRRALDKLRRLTGANVQPTEPACGRWPHGAPTAYSGPRPRPHHPLHRDRIAWCYTRDEKVTACTHEGEQYPLDRTLETLQTELPAADFFRANRQFIVARRAVKEIAVWFGSRLTIALSARGTRTDRGAESPRGRIQAVAQGVPPPPGSRSTGRIGRFTRRAAPFSHFGATFATEGYGITVPRPDPKRITT